MTDNEIMEQLKNILHMLKPKTDLANVTLQTNLVTDLGVDSLSQMLMSIAIEDSLNINFDSAVNFQTVGDVVEYVKGKLA